MPIRIVNLTTWKNPTVDGSPATITIPATTAGNVMVLVYMYPDNRGGDTVNIGAQTFTFVTAGNFASMEIDYIPSVAGGQTSITFQFNAPGAFVLYELSPCTLVTSSAKNGSPAVSQQLNSVTSSGNCAYIAGAGQGTSGETPVPNSYASVSSPWSLDYAVNAIATHPYGEFATASLLNSTGTQQPTFTLSSGTTPNVGWEGVDVVFQGAASNPVIISNQPSISISS